MKAIALTNEGLEDISANEINELIQPKNEIKKEKGFVVFETELLEVLKVCYRAQSLKKVLLLISIINLNSLNLEAIELNNLKSKTFSVEGIGQNKKNIEDKLISFFKSKQFTLNYKNPENHFFYILNEAKCYFCIDVSTQDLSRRDYRIFLKAESYKGNIAYAMLKIGKYNPKNILLDPFCRDGIIAIESALFAVQKSPNYYNKEKFYFTQMQKFKNINFEKIFNENHITIKDIETRIIAIDSNFANIQAAKKNAKIAGVIDCIEFSRQSLEWIDIKFEKNSVDKIITFPIQPSSLISEKTIEKVYSQFFDRSTFILKKNGVIVCGLKRGADLLKKKAEEKKFKVTHERIVKQGKEDVNILMFERVI